MQFVNDENVENADYLMMVLSKCGLGKAERDGKSEMQMDEIKAQHVAEQKSMSADNDGDALDGDEGTTGL